MSNSVDIDGERYYELKVFRIEKHRFKNSPDMQTYFKVAFYDDKAADGYRDRLGVSMGTIDLSNIIAASFFFKAIVSAMYNERRIFVAFTTNQNCWMVKAILPKIVPIMCPFDVPKADPSGEFDALDD